MEVTKPAKPIVREKAEAHTFVISIKSCENQTWQGTVNWVEQRKTQAFRSALELIKLLDSTLQDDEK